VSVEEKETELELKRRVRRDTISEANMPSDRGMVFRVSYQPNKNTAGLGY